MQCDHSNIEQVQDKCIQAYKQQIRQKKECHAGAPPPKIGKNKKIWRKIVNFHTKYPKNVRASLRNWKKYDFLGVKS